MEQALAAADDRLACHDLHLDGGQLHLDVNLPQELENRQEEIVQGIRNALATTPDVVEVLITFDLI